MDREQIQRDGEKAVLTAWDRALTRPSETAVDTVQARLAVVAAQAPLLAAIDELEARNAKLEAVARDDVRDMANFCIAQGASKPWQEIARRLLAALDALDG